LFIPGPVHVLPEVLQQLARPTLGHRGKEYSQLHGEVTGMLKKVLFTEQNVFLSTSSASGIWEGAIRNCVNFQREYPGDLMRIVQRKRASVAKKLRPNVDDLKVEWG
jgi:aspartate aminotransferase-like enzyme